jgi:hypothetical protein
MYISRNFWFDHLFFENHGKISIKNSVVAQTSRQWAGLDGSWAGDQWWWQRKQMGLGNATVRAVVRFPPIGQGKARQGV